MNDVVYQIASFMLMRNPVTWRWSHARHHTDTIIVGRDAEIAGDAAAGSVPNRSLNFVGIFDVYYSLKALLKNAAGTITPDEGSFIPEMERGKAVTAARVHVALYAATIVAALFMRSWMPLMLIGLPRLYGCWHMVLVGLLQHGGLAEHVDGPSPQFPHRLYERHQPVHLPQHELSR